MVRKLKRSSHNKRMTSMANQQNISTSAKVPGSKSTVKPNKSRNPTGYVHERKSRDARKQMTKPGKGGKINAWGLKARCGDDPHDWYSNQTTFAPKIRMNH